MIDTAAVFSWSLEQASCTVTLLARRVIGESQRAMRDPSVITVPQLPHSNYTCTSYDNVPILDNVTVLLRDWILPERRSLSATIIQRSPKSSVTIFPFLGATGCRYELNVLSSNRSNDLSRHHTRINSALFPT
jgi:hypothetical protein